VNELCVKGWQKFGALGHASAVATLPPETTPLKNSLLSLAFVAYHLLELFFVAAKIPVRM
jgi:hypothetical protein